MLSEAVRCVNVNVTDTLAEVRSILSPYCMSHASRLVHDMRPVSGSTFYSKETVRGETRTLVYMARANCRQGTRCSVPWEMLAASTPTLLSSIPCQFIFNRYIVLVMDQ